MIDFVNADGLGVIRTPEMLVELMQKWQTQSGGFGTCMLLHHELANPEATVRSHELLARLVMPEFQGKADAIRAAEARAAAVRAGEPGPASQLQVVPFLMPSVADGCPEPPIGLDDNPSGTRRGPSSLAVRTEGPANDGWPA